MILLQAQGGNGMFSIVMMVGMIAVFYFFMIRPQQKKTEDQKKMVEELKEGDEIVTFGGMHGKIVAKDETTVTISAGGGARLTFDKTAIARKK
ncbi:preprotein translocase subunit YajC [Emticicia aquatilis]|uniref:Sec translocon accessory complex subunit YajC n=1 Tax=Emticicia aquatilis TaxID=1537369 RepID=A0A916Z1F7_9BACT|nr:preprotein translocase subunit YajC [Emticicia aquatilis]GGD71404.1 preprotein translocase subunit YajC [Emticicia aquatilis]